MDATERRVREVLASFHVDVPDDAMSDVVRLAETMLDVQRMLDGGSNTLAATRALDLDTPLAIAAFALATEDASLRAIDALQRSKRHAALTPRDGIVLVQGVHAGIDLVAALRLLKASS